MNDPLEDAGFILHSVKKIKGSEGQRSVIVFFQSLFWKVLKLF